MPTPNPDTHCTSCGEVLSIYDHCWKCLTRRWAQVK